MNYLHEGCRVLSENGLHHWKCKVSKSKTSWGHCDYTRETIYLSKYLLEFGLHDEIIQTIYHEVAHALTPSTEGHGADWLVKARELGYRGSVQAERVLPFRHRFIGHCSDGHKFCTEEIQKSFGCGLCSEEITWYDRNEPSDVEKFIRYFGKDEFNSFEKTLGRILGMADAISK